MRVSGSQFRAAPMVEALEERQLMSAAPHVVWTGAFNNKLPGFGTYSYTAASDPADPAPFTWNWSLQVRRHNGNAFGGWMWETADEKGPRMKIEGAASKDGFVHFRVTFGKNDKPPFLALYNPATKQYTGSFGYLPDHKNHANHAGELFGTFVFQMSDPKKY